MKALKYANLFRNYALSSIAWSTLMVRIIPTDSCNLNCRYCYQKTNDSPVMTWDTFTQVLAKARKLHVGLLSFLGGEPLLWEHLDDAITLATRHHILTDITTNGVLLNERTIERMAQAGLDCINVSVDTRSDFSMSRKNTLFNPELMAQLKSAEKRFGMKVRMNAVITRKNFSDIKELLELSHDTKTPISLGFVVPELGSADDGDIYFGEEDDDLLHNIVDYILAKKHDKYPVIDPDSYFADVFRFVNHEKFWSCNYPTRFGWFNVTPGGTIRSCTKKMDDTGVEFTSLTSTQIADMKESFASSISGCNHLCYSNCAYDSAFYKKHKISFLINNFSRTF
ncbi:MAG: radical SAM protein [Propionibacteriaceae bacterium]|nr:radical SAM protein [Propionibacteriaceae bacterium]